ncbi:hypothetical protein KSD_62960 [Ktedonobacter sp. SOSP1-85]|uniref:DinB family protein n=1 Tax=Ktedonobacter sp. SOSP1-85 TaxID=2778367 RepID=UPI001916153B|nr:DinB family protein [Ktedonobacter sp. SOSP1-85]GHO78525.1 hypothetical protein KSD_62960 [Ktedonobacter sp. SOSP1-85]
MPENGSTLAVFYENWLNYQNLIIKAIAPLTSEQLTQRADPRLRSIDIILRHVIGARARWFHQMMGIGDEEFISMGGWDRRDAPERSAAELVHGLEKTWSVMYEAISRWTEEDWHITYQNDPGDEPETFTRQWIIWHLIEHDIHHGGEVSLTLGMHGLQAPDL